MLLEMGSILDAPGMGVLQALQETDLIPNQIVSAVPRHWTLST